ncbi:MAG TPA: ABC transporter ATP-binding protein [Rhodospirillales bacterium]|jgi:ABC-2 type transport system ATP-binding protein|nr:ABC transporter ATP-binding protein [Rhodospirillaceae bacterium]HJN23699.1 ABC transporter ATP-binding protein [Rhodospirillales bacterium]
MTKVTASPVVVVEDLAKRFGEAWAVEKISFEVPPLSTTALVGGNGAGKTTTLSILLGLLLPTSGTVSVFGENILRHRHRVLGRMNFSSPYVDLPRRLSVAENLTVYAHLYGLDRIAERLRALARDLEITPFLNRPTGELSAGQKTRVALAKALLNRPRLLLLDEPTASLDPETADWVRAYLESWRRRTGATIILASHNMAEVERLCDHIMFMRDGRIVERGTPAELIGRRGKDNLEEVFLSIARKPGGAGEGFSAVAR